MINKEIFDLDLYKLAKEAKIKQEARKYAEDKIKLYCCEI